MTEINVLVRHNISALECPPHRPLSPPCLVTLRQQSGLR